MFGPSQSRKPVSSDAVEPGASSMIFERLACAVLNVEPAAWNAGGEPADIGKFLDAGRYHGVLPLLAAAFRIREDLAARPEQIRAAFRPPPPAQTRCRLGRCAAL